MKYFLMCLFSTILLSYGEKSSKQQEKSISELIALKALLSENKVDRFKIKKLIESTDWNKVSLHDSALFYVKIKNYELEVVETSLLKTQELKGGC